MRLLACDRILLMRLSNFRFVKERLTPVIRSEEQYLFLCHLIGPFLSRFNVDRPSPCILDLTVELFTALNQVNSANEELKYIDPICDLLYPLNIYEAEYHFSFDILFRFSLKLPLRNTDLCVF